MNKRPVVITTKHRGVFFGYVEDDSKTPEKITLLNARMCIYWTASIKGVLGLASVGPDSNCRIGLAVPRFEAWEITSITDCTPEAAEKWEQGPWK